MNPTDAEVQDLLGDPEVVEAIAAGLAGELLKHKREVTRLQAALETTTLEAREAEARADWLTGELCDARGENAALRARALPVLEWKPVENGFWCVVGSTVLNVQKATEEGSFWRWSVGVQPEEDMIDVCENPWRKLFTSPEEAKSACEAAFLRLVGAGHG